MLKILAWRIYIYIYICPKCQVKIIELVYICNRSSQAYVFEIHRNQRHVHVYQCLETIIYTSLFISTIGTKSLQKAFVQVVKIVPSGCKTWQYLPIATMSHLLAGTTTTCIYG